MNVRLKRVIAVVIIIAIGAVSATVLAEHFSSPQTYAKTIETLDEKRNSVLAMTASAAAISTGLTIIPGDVATPLADKLADLSSTFMIVLCAIFLEKYMLAFAGIAAFRVLIPLACLLIAVFLYTRSERCLRIARKSVVLGLCIVILVPASTWVTGFIEETYSVSIEENIQETDKTAEILNSNAGKDESAVSKWLSSLKGGVSEIVRKAENALGNFIEAAALLLITSCVIPVLTLVLFIWIINAVLGLDLKLPGKKLGAISTAGSKLRGRANKSDKQESKYLED